MTQAPVEKAAARLRLALIVAWGLLLVAYAAGRIGLSVGPFEFEAKVHSDVIWQALTVADVSIALLTVALIRLIRMLGLVAGGDFFSAAVVRNFRAFAFWLLMLTLVWVLAPIILALMKPPGADGHRYAVALNVRDLVTVGISLILFLVARLLERARDYEAESREFV